MLAGVVTTIDHPNHDSDLLEKEAFILYLMI